MIILLVILHDFKVAGIWVHKDILTHISYIYLMWSQNGNKAQSHVTFTMHGFKPGSAIQSSSVNRDPEAAVGSIRIKLVEFREHLRASLPRDKVNCP